MAGCACDGCERLYHLFLCGFLEILDQVPDFCVGNSTAAILISELENSPEQCLNTLAVLNEPCGWGDHGVLIDQPVGVVDVKGSKV